MTERGDDRSIHVQRVSGDDLLADATGIRDAAELGEHLHPEPVDPLEIGLAPEHVVEHGERPGEIRIPPEGSGAREEIRDRERIDADEPVGRREARGGPSRVKAVAPGEVPERIHVPGVRGDGVLVVADGRLLTASESFVLGEKGMGVRTVDALQVAGEFGCFPEGLFARLEMAFEGPVVDLCEAHVQERLLAERVEALLEEPYGPLEGGPRAEEHLVVGPVTAFEDLRIGSRALRQPLQLERG